MGNCAKIRNLRISSCIHVSFATRCSGACWEKSNLAKSDSFPAFGRGWNANAAEGTRYMLLRTVLLGPLIALSVVSSGHATIILTATLTNSQEVPPTVPTTSTGDPRPASFGTATFVLNDAMTVDATIFNIDFTG